jgi:hypothetical protein
MAFHGLDFPHSSPGVDSADSGHGPSHLNQEALRMSQALLTMMLLTTPGQFLEDLVDDVVDERYETVAVMPQPVYRDAQGKTESIGGELGPQAAYFCSRLQEEINELGDGEFDLVEASRMQDVCRSYSLAQIQRKSIRQRIAEQAGDADVLVIPVVTNSGSPAKKFDLKCVLVDVESNDEEEYGVEELLIGLSDAAYMGESWNLRRWSADGKTLLNIGLEESGAVPGSALFGTGPRMEQRQYQWIDRKRPHPLTVDSGLPIGIDILVSSKKRPIRVSTNDAFVALDDGEEPVIRLSNSGSQDVYALMFVDGVNVMGKHREHPGEVIPKDKHRLIRAGKNTDFEGWYTRKAGDVWNVESFRLTDERNTVAAEQGSTEQLGHITCLFYTVGWSGVPPGDRFVISKGRLGFGTGRSRPVTLDETSAESPGLMMSAVTIRYGRSNELNGQTP